MDAPSKTEPELQALINRLHAGGRIRVWSLVITLFGDAIVPRDGEAPLALIQSLMERLSIESGAVRTAMSRLAADHWVERERRGRNSFFRLDERGRHAFDLATRRIYAAGPPSWDGSWTVAIAGKAPPASDTLELKESGFLKLSDTVFLRPRRVNQDSDLNMLLSGMLVIRGESADHPEHIRALWPSAEIAASYDELIEAWRPLARRLERSGAMRGIDAMAARILLIHDWRRIVLRDPGLPAALLPRDWPGEKARNLTAAIYAHLREPSDAWLDAAGLPAPQEKSGYDSRFSRI